MKSLNPVLVIEKVLPYALDRVEQLLLKTNQFKLNNTVYNKKQIELNGKNYEALHFKFLSSDETLPDNKKLNTDIWYDANTLIWLKAQFIKQGNWEYRLKKLN